MALRIERAMSTAEMVMNVSLQDNEQA